MGNNKVNIMKTNYQIEMALLANQAQICMPDKSKQVEYVETRLYHHEMVYIQENPTFMGTAIDFLKHRFAYAYSEAGEFKRRDLTKIVLGN